MNDPLKLLCGTCWKTYLAKSWEVEPCPSCYIKFTDWSYATLSGELYTYYSQNKFNGVQFSPNNLGEFIKELWLAWVSNISLGESDKALRYNEGKIRWSLVHFPSLEPMVEVLEYWSKKYAEENWKKPMPKKQILESMMRHLVRLMEDEELDSESWLPHVWHILANCMFYSYHSTHDKSTHKDGSL